MAPLKILIVGCSIAGPTLATFLRLSDLPASDKPHITVVERSSTIRKQGQNVDIRGGGVTIIRKLGVENVIRASTTGGVNSLARGVRREGGAGIEYIFGDCLGVLEQSGSQVHLRFAKSGKKQGFDVVVGADGLQSGTRVFTWGSAGEKDRIKRLGMFSAFFSIPKGDTDSEWRRWYHAPGRRWIMVRPSDQKHKTTVLMSVVNEEDARLVQVASNRREDMGAQKRLMAEYFEDAGWESHRIIEGMMETTDFYYDLVAQVKMDKWSQGRVISLGDAGYCASPISAMGTTLAFIGAYNLAGALLRNPEEQLTAFAKRATTANNSDNLPLETQPLQATLFSLLNKSPIPSVTMGVCVSILKMDLSWGTRWFLLKNHIKQLLKRWNGNPAASDFSFSRGPSELWDAWERSSDAPVSAVRPDTSPLSSPLSSVRFYSLPRIRRLSQRWTVE
ncbi:hypothetical protein PV04_03063 [Phialophora macrospora]|uniref:FAD-binding domain-containing protein n=1 Tax=Phialophora macrospora TaxID=1851006 RepID=A0A0D2FWG1_9EURO|nr:hypothetical protein PV04_03063 [Phialophora macrospora]